MKDIPVVSAATVFTSENGRNYILVFYKAFYMLDMMHTLINLNQCLHFGSKVQDNPYHEDFPVLIEIPEWIIFRMLAVSWDRYVLRYLLSHAGRPRVISAH